ncbi:hypothetical protein [Chitinophaga flava]|uniref:Uncharacterized protein n=1 Tax=Chitinophaga flava TaxID=2259036 RepID=A0A365XRR7_9BACT|nr:hypothetical protein [Chitinophaga flava]RBL89042.1 hypothetical protein DF182_21120 [Chitinophaga flava]
MKKFLFLMFTMWSVSTADAQSKETSVNCQNMLQQVLTRVKEEKDISKLYDQVNTLKRLSAMYPGEWLPDYYIAYFDLKLVLSKAGAKPEDLLQEAADKLTALKANNSADMSEVYTLEAYYYYAMISLNPAVNGQKYYREVIGGYEKAIRLSQQNPRPQLQLAIFQNRMAAFTKAADNSFCDKLQQVEKTFHDFKPATAVSPDWGLPELLYVKESSCH